ncbi:MAG: copper resistance CopC family protein [Kineosporiaceae bacterium]
MAALGRGLRDRLVTVALLAGVVAAAAGVAPPPAAAHDRLLSSDPAAGADLAAPPAAMTLTYSADVAGEFTQAVVTPPGGDPVPLTPEALTAAGPVLTVDLAELAPGAAAGTWTVVVRIVSTDGHPVEESVAFEAGSGPAATAATGGESGPPGVAPTAPSTTGTPVPEASPAAAEPQVDGVDAEAGPGRRGTVVLAVLAAAVVAALAAGAVLAVRRR